jgi:excisionase family DNA binding protein
MSDNTSVPNSPRLLTRKEAADYFGITTHTLSIWTRFFAIPSVKLGRLVRYRLADLESFAESKSRILTATKPEHNIQDELNERFK